MDKTDRLLKQMKPEVKVPVNTNFSLPNYSVVAGAKQINAQVNSISSQGAITGTTVTASGIIKTTGDQESADTEYCANVVFTSGALPAANTTARGTIGIVYTA